MCSLLLLLVVGVVVGGGGGEVRAVDAAAVVAAADGSSKLASGPGSAGPHRRNWLVSVPALPAMRPFVPFHRFS